MNMIILLKLMKLMINLELMVKKLLLDLLKFIYLNIHIIVYVCLNFLKIYFFKNNIILQNISIYNHFVNFSFCLIYFFFYLYFNSFLFKLYSLNFLSNYLNFLI